MTDIYKAPSAELQEPAEAGRYGSIENALAGNFQIKPIESMKSAWAILKGMKTTFWLAVIAYSLIAMALEFVLSRALGYSMFAEEYQPIQIIGTVISTLLLSPMAAGLYMITIKHSVGAKIGVGELFSYFHKILPIFLTTILIYLLVGIGLILLIIPGIYLLVCFSFSLFLVVEKDMSPIEALKTSRKAVHQQWFQTAGLLLLSVLVCILGAVALLVGLLWAIPLTALTLALVYRDVFGVEDKTLNT